MNSAQRLYDLFTEAKAHRGDAPAYTVWMKIFQLQDEPTEEHEDLGIACITALREELDILRAALRDMECPEHLYSHAISGLRAIASPGQFHAGWMHVADRIGPEHLMMLKWAGWILGKEEDVIAEEDRAKLLHDVENMIAELALADVPQFTKQLMLRHLDAMRRALHSYKARGIEPLNAALHETVGAMRTQSTHVSTDTARAGSEAQGFIAKAIGVINKVAEYADKVQKVQKGVDAGVQIAHQVNAVWAQLPHFPALSGTNG